MAVHDLCMSHGIDRRVFLVRRFAMALTGPPQDIVVATPDKIRWRARTLLSRAAFLVWEAAADALRAVWLFVLFAPLAVTAPLALQWDYRRLEWMHWLRCGPTLIMFMESCHAWIACRFTRCFCTCVLYLFCDTGHPDLAPVLGHCLSCKADVLQGSIMHSVGI